MIAFAAFQLVFLPIQLLLFLGVRQERLRQERMFRFALMHLTRRR